MADDEITAEVPDKMFFRIGEAASLVGVEPHVLRYWESEFKMRPQRSPSGQRMYRRKDIGKFLRIRKLLHEEGFTIAGARKALLEPAAEGGVSSADPTRIKTALEKIAQIRSRIAEIRTNYASVGVAEPLSDS